MSSYAASPDLFVNVLTYGLVAFLGALAAGILAAAWFVPYAWLRVGLVAVALGCLAIPVTAYLYSPRSYVLTRDALIVHRPLGDVEVPVAAVRGAERTDARLGFALRTWGNGGLFGIYGRFYTQDLGNFRMYASRTRDAVVIATDREKIVITPDRPEEFLRDLKERMDAIASRAPARETEDS